jgi:hypothetical protein
MLQSTGLLGVCAAQPGALNLVLTITRRLLTGDAVWWGHDPDGAVVLEGDSVRATMGNDTVTMSRATFEAGMRTVADDLAAFAVRFHEWLRRHTAHLASQLTDLFTEQMHITTPHQPQRQL